MFYGSFNCQTFITPQDKGQTRPALAHFVSGAKTAVHFRLYACTLKDEFLDNVVKQDNAGLDCMGLFDHMQACGHVQAPLMKDFYASIKNPANYQITTSPLRNIQHQKSVWVNLYMKDGNAVYVKPAMYHEWVPGEMGRFTPLPTREQDVYPWDQALEEGTPIVWSGSWNFSASADDQGNNVDVMPSIWRSEGFEQAFQTDYAWALQNEQKLQIYGPAKQL